MEARRIIWKKWADPFRAAVEEHRERGWADSYQYLERPGQAGVYQGPLLTGGMGLIPLNELNCPGKNFNLWVGHAGFEIDGPTFDRMKSVPGVEVLRAWTRYRLWLGVGLAFDEGRVKQQVNRAALPPRPAAPRKVDALGALAAGLAGRHPHWAIFATANGRLVFAAGDCLQEVEREAAGLAAVARHLASSWEESRG